MSNTETDRKFVDTGIDIKRIYEQTSQISEEPLWSLMEVDFVTHFLPVFSGEETSPEKLGDWTRMAGGPGRYVEIKDRDGNRLFMVPPLQLPAIINSNAPTLKGLHVYSILDNFKRIAMAKSAGIAKQYLDNRLEEYGEQVRTTPNLQKYQQEWQAIFDRYNIVIKDQSDSAEQQKADGDEVVGFDPM